MLSSSTADASICLRCHLRLLIRQIAPRARPTFQQRRHQSSERIVPENEQSAGQQHGAESEKPNTLRIRRGPRSARKPRFRETTARLPIASLNADTEVIVLRDLPSDIHFKINGPPKAVQQDELSKDHAEIEPALTAKDIESFASSKTKKPLQKEVNASIDASRFVEAEVVTKQQYEDKVKELVTSYSIGQLRKYALPKSTRATKAPQVGPYPPEAKGLSISSVKRQLSATQWTPLTGSRAVPERERLPYGRYGLAKRQAAEYILRDCWNVRIEDELSEVGELNIYLRPIQLDLWLNSTSEAVKSVMPSSRYYQNSKLQLLSSEGTLRLTGPKAEVEAMAGTIQEAFKNSGHFTIDLNTVTLLLPQSTSFDTIYSTAQLREIMSLTNSNIIYDKSENKVRVTNFDKDNMRDTLRLLYSLLPVPSRKTISETLQMQQSEKQFMMSMPRVNGLPYRHRSEHLGRLVQVASKASRGSVRIDDKSDKPDSKQDDREMMVQTLSKCIPSSPREAVKGLYVSDQYWNAEPEQLPWKARIGQLLRPITGPNPVVADAPIVLTPKHDAAVSPSSNSKFMPSFPASLGALSQLGLLSNPVGMESPSQVVKRRQMIRPPVQLIAKLTPSPFSDLGPLATSMFPEVTLKFREELPVNEHATQAHQPSGPPELKFVGMQATLAHEMVDVALPDQSVDLRFDRKLVLKSRRAEDDAHIKTFISVIINSEKSKEGVIRAPSTLTLDLPTWTLKAPVVDGFDDSEAVQTLQKKWESLSKKQSASMTYNFAGFEYRERRNIDPAQGSLAKDAYFSPEHVLRVEHVEGGIMFGKRVQATILSKQEHVPLHRTMSRRGEAEPALLRTVLPMPAIFRSKIETSASEETGPRTEQRLVRTTLSLVDLIDRVQRREWRLSPTVQQKIKVSNARRQHDAKTKFVQGEQKLYRYADRSERPDKDGGIEEPDTKVETADDVKNTLIPEA